MSIGIVVGTRPEIIKMSPIIRVCELEKIDYFVLHTGQHYTYGLDGIFFEELGLSAPRYNLKVGSGTHAVQTAQMLVGIEKVLARENPRAILVQGDTNTVLAGALVAAKLHIRVGHVEAGLRSRDRSMPEEINRILADHIADYLFVPTDGAKAILQAEGISAEKIWVTGNTIVDAVQQHLQIAQERSSILKELSLESQRYFLVTVHRQENVDSRVRFDGILRGLYLLQQEYGVPLIYPLHPRARKRMQEFGLEPQGVRVIDPLGYLDFLQLEAQASLVLTDSGGVQEESCILEVPCVTLRDNTERPETLEIGSNALAGTAPQSILAQGKEMLSRDRNWINPFGDGSAGKRIVDILSGCGLKLEPDGCVD